MSRRRCILIIYREGQRWSWRYEHANGLPMIDSWFLYATAANARRAARRIAWRIFCADEKRRP